MTQFVWQPIRGRFGDWLIEQLQSGRWTNAIFVSAFVRMPGLTTLAAAIDTFNDAGGELRAWVGVNFHGTSEEALRFLVAKTAGSYVAYNPGSSTFHAKVYAFYNPHRAIVAVGSSNLTGGGLFTNTESNVIVSVRRRAKPGSDLLDSVLDGLQTLPRENIQPLNDALINQLVASGLVSFEASSPLSPDEAMGGFSGAAIPPFSHVPVLPPPRGTAYSPPKRSRRARSGGGQSAPSSLPGPSVFVMTLSVRDTRQRRGFSREVYIPLAARDAEPVFWQWPYRFVNDERRVQVRLHPAHAGPTVLDDRRLWYYPTKHEFRFNLGPLLAGASPGDLVVVEQTSDPTVEYDVTVVAQSDPDYSQWAPLAAQTVDSGRRWGYA